MVENGGKMNECWEGREKDKGEVGKKHKLNKKKKESREKGSEEVSSWRIPEYDINNLNETRFDVVKKMCYDDKMI